MALPIVEANDVSPLPIQSHLEPAEVAAFVDRALDAAARERIERHLMQCADCREEVVGVSAIVAERRRPRQRRLQWVAAAAAAAILVVAWPRATREPDVVHREAPLTAIAAPLALAPRGETTDPLAIRWTSVPRADSYRARIYDDQGSVLFERETTDTVLTITGVRLAAGQRYYWKVEARTGFDRSTASELTEFILKRPARQ